jgi:hypothetical protein
MNWSRKKRPSKIQKIKKGPSKKRKSKSKRKFVGGLGKVNCNLANTSHTEGTCLPNDAIDILKKEYNKDHPNAPIMETDPKQILRRVMESVKCSNIADERCALNVIDDVTLRKKYLNILYAPEHPESWLKNPDEWLTNEDIDEIMVDLESKYPDFEAFRTSPIDFDKHVWGQCVEIELCEFSLKKYLDKGKKRFGAVFNLDKHDQSGSHWVSLFISVDDAAIVFFDSALGGVPTEIKTFVKRVQSEATNLGKSLKFYTNTSEHQKGDTECGMYSIYFITEMLSDFKNLDVFLKGRIDDKTVFNMRGKFYNKPL